MQNSSHSPQAEIEELQAAKHKLEERNKKLQNVTGEENTQEEEGMKLKVENKRLKVKHPFFFVIHAAFSPRRIDSFSVDTGCR